MQTHLKTLGILHVIYGALTLLILATMSTIVQSLLPFILSNVDEETLLVLQIILPVARIVAYTLMILIPIPSIIGGMALLNKKKWGLTLLMIPGSLSLISFPLGTAIGIYTIWVFTQQPNNSNDQD
ncbi:hypothetical protein [Marinoscillum sp. MHG1-6]|uniref:hypothetical protein n=1 Tax=Marinoscillum sp. MHG1-6 TaxID=2959627 RepID=UPI002157B347|nr:hypothetical protein [Marinoscillum sp. MHG1-6]